MGGAPHIQDGSSSVKPLGNCAHSVLRDSKYPQLASEDWLSQSGTVLSILEGCFLVFIQYHLPVWEILVTVTGKWHFCFNSFYCMVF